MNWGNRGRWPVNKDPHEISGHEFQMELVWQHDDAFFSGHIQVPRRQRFGCIVRTGVARGVGWREARGAEVEVGSKKGSVCHCSHVDREDLRGRDDSEEV